jgi:hypothetical protein
MKNTASLLGQLLEVIGQTTRNPTKENLSLVTTLAESWAQSYSPKPYTWKVENLTHALYVDGQEKPFARVLEYPEFWVLDAGRWSVFQEFGTLERCKAHAEELLETQEAMAPDLG